MSDNKPTKLEGKWGEYHSADICRSNKIVRSVIDDPEMSVDDICSAVDKMLEVVHYKATFAEFLEETNLTGQERLN